MELNRRLYLGILFFMLLLAPVLAAQEAEDERSRLEDRITVTADRLVESPAEATSAVSIITRAEIEASGALWLRDVLEWAPGVKVVQAGGPGGVTSVFMRGLNSNHTLVLVDGIRVGQPTTGAFDFAHLPATRIERVEIVRGSHSVAYGSEAVGGVINVVTRRGRGAPVGALRVAVGAFGTSSADAWVEGASGDLDYAGSLSWLNSDSFSAATGEGELESDGYRNLSVDGRVGFRAPERDLDIEAFFRAQDTHTRIDGFGFGVGPIDDANAIQESTDLFAGTRVAFQRGRWRGQVMASITELGLSTTDPDNAFALSTRIDGRISELDWQNDLSLSKSHHLVAGLELRRDEASYDSRSISGPMAFVESIDTLGAFIQDRVEITRDVDVTLGVRHEDHSTAGAHTTFRVSASGRLPGSPLRLRGSIGSGFRAPSLNDLYFPFFGNLELASEQSTGFDIGVEGYWLEQQLRVDLTYFENRVDELIQFSFATFVAENIARASSKGLEMVVEIIPATGIRFDATYTFTDAVDETNGLPLVRRPRHQALFRATARPIERLRLFAELRLVSKRQDFSPFGRVTLDSYALLNAALEYRLTSLCAATARLENAFDHRYQQVFGFATPARSLYAGLRLQVGGS